MIYAAKEYAELKEFVLASIAKNRSITLDEAMEADINFDAATSLFSQLFIRRLKTEGRIGQRTVDSLVQRVAAGESLLTISQQEFNLGTYKIARIYCDATIGKSFPLSTIVTNPKSIESERVRMDLLKMMEIDPICSHEIGKRLQVATSHTIQNNRIRVIM